VLLLDEVGMLSDATLRVGTVMTTGCSGTWAEPGMMVTCSDCMVTLTER
jgi:hypothetical protein